MADFRGLFGQRYNMLEGRIITLVSGTENPLYPRSRLWDGRPSQEFRFNTAVANCLIRVDANAIVNALGTVDEGKFNGWTASGPDGFTKVVTGTGAVSQENTIVRSGSSVRIEPGSSGTAALIRDRVVRAGEIWNIEAWPRGGAGAGVLRCEVQNLDTKKYLTSGGLWQTAQVDWTTENNAADFVQKLRSFTVESFAQCGWRDTVTLRFKFYNTVANSSAYIEDFAFWPAGIDLVAIFGHNLDPSIDVQVVADEDPAYGSVTNLASLTPWPVPSGYLYLGSPQNFRYWQVGLIGTNVNPIEIGELVLAQTFAPSRHPNFGYELSYLQDDIASETPGGELHVVQTAKHERRTFALPFRYGGGSHAQFDEARDEIFRRSRGRVHPLVLIPDTDRSDILHGRRARTFKVLRTFLHTYDEADLTVVESPFASTSS